jgi:hypothetical protein
VTAERDPRPGRGERARPARARPAAGVVGWSRVVLGRIWGLVAGHPILGLCLLLAGLDLILVYPAVLGGRVLAPEDSLFFNPPLSALRPAGLLHPSNYLLGDAVQVFHPDLEWARSMVRAGHLPLWDPYVFGGWPVFASQQTAMLYPLNLLAYVMPFFASVGVTVVLKTLLAGAGAWWLCRRLHLGRPAALIAALAYSLGSYFVIWLEHPHTNIYALIPWLLGAIDLICKRRRIGDAAMLAAIVGLCMLGGHPESSVIAGLAGAPFAAFCLTGPDAAGARRRCLLLIAGAVVVGVAGGAVMLVPGEQLADQAPRLARGGTAGLPDQSLLSALLPDLWGRPDSGFEVASAPANYAERTLYIGVLPLMLALVGLYRLRGRGQRFFVGLLAGAAVVSLHVPAVTGAIDGLPGLSFIALNRVLILVVLSLAILAGYGLERLLEADERERRVMFRLAAGLAVLPVLWLVRHGSLLHDLPRFSDLAPSLWGSSRTQAETGAGAVTRWALFAVGGLGVIGLLSRSLRRGRGRQTTLALALGVGLVAVDLLALNHGYHPAVPEAQAAPPATPSILLARAGQGSGRTIGFNEALIPNVSSRYLLRDPRGHGLPALGRYLALWNGLGGFGFEATRLRAGDGHVGRLLDDFGVTQLITRSQGSAPANAGLKLVARNRDAAVFRNSHALPRAYVATTWQAVAGQAAALTATEQSTADQLRAAPVVEEADPSPAPAPAAATAAAVPHGGTVAFVDDGDDVVALNVVAHADGYLVLLDSYYPGWKVTVDGRPGSIHPANEAFRGVPIRAGHHEVVFTYRPSSIVNAAWLSAGAWLAILAVLVAAGIARRRRRPPGRMRAPSLRRPRARTA